MKRVLTIVTIALPFAAFGSLIRPASAISGSEFSSLYDIGNTIDGSGILDSFSITGKHDDYKINNHWTTKSGAIANGTAWAEFQFSKAEHIAGIVLWNHRSNNIADNPDYAVAQFDLILKDGLGNVISVLEQRNPTGNNALAQPFVFPSSVKNVKSARFVIRKNFSASGTSGFTGLAEVGFMPVPEPATVIALAGGMVALIRRRRTKS